MHVQTTACGTYIIMIQKNAIEAFKLNYRKASVATYM